MKYFHVKFPLAENISIDNREKILILSIISIEESNMKIIAAIGLILNAIIALFAGIMSALGGDGFLLFSSLVYLGILCYATVLFHSITH